jgi:ketosteroid isomerase-like protein
VADNPSVRKGSIRQRVSVATASDAERLGHAYVAAYNERDLDAMLAVLDPDVVAYPSPLFERRPANVGHDGVRAWWQTMIDADRWYEVVVSHIRQAADGQWAIVGEIQQDGQFESPWLLVFRIRDGLISESRSYLSDEQVVAELGRLRDAG